MRRIVICGQKPYMRAIPSVLHAMDAPAAAEPGREDLCHPHEEEACSVALLLMPKATAVWLVDNTSLSFEQIAEFCHLHPLEVKSIADGEVAAGIKGLDPVLTGQLTREEIVRAEKDPGQQFTQNHR